MQVAVRQPEEAARLGPRLGVALGGAEVGHLRPDERPVGDAVVEQRAGDHGAGVLLVGRHERVGVVRVAEPAEVHHQEGEVGHHVEVAQVVVELDAVEDPRSVVEAEDVVGAQVAVAVAHLAVGHPLGVQGRPAAEPARREPLHLVEHAAARRCR